MSKKSIQDVLKKEKKSQKQKKEEGKCWSYHSEEIMQEQRGPTGGGGHSRAQREWPDVLAVFPGIKHEHVSKDHGIGPFECKPRPRNMISGVEKIEA